ncbi:MAG: glycosyltransferase [Planctomycetes bacterium]|nr:glycosyltransferase [Planctomycetota bacterium]
MSRPGRWPARLLSGQQHARPRRIAFVQYTNPGAYPPLQGSSRHLADRGWEVLFLGTSSLGAATLQFPPHPRVRSHCWARPRGGLCQKLHYAAFVGWCLGWTLAWRPGWVYVSEPLAAPVGALVVALTRIPVLYHEHDAPGAASRTSGLAALVERARRRLVRAARACIVPAEGRLQHLPPGVTETRVVWNCPRLEEVGPARVARPTGPKRLVYSGSIGPERLPLALIEALALLRGEVELRVYGYETVGTIGHLERLRGRARALGIEGSLDIRGSLPRFELLPALRACDVGWAAVGHATDDPNLRSLVGASNKVFDYLSQGLPPIVGDDPGWQELVVDPGYGVACDPCSPGSIADTLRGLLGRDLLAMGERGRQRIVSEWNYDAQFRPVVDLLEGDA